MRERDRVVAWAGGRFEDAGNAAAMTGEAAIRIDLCPNHLAGGSRRPLRTSRPLWPGGSLRPLRPDRAGISLGPLSARCAGVAFRSLRPGVAGRALRPLRPR